MPEVYAKNQVEEALFASSFTILQETGTLTMYQTNICPGDDIIIDWDRGSCEWDDLEVQLRYHGVDPTPIHDYLRAL